MSEILTDWCPNCDYRLTIEGTAHNYAILDNGHAVTSCPNCLIPLMVEDGVLKKDEQK